MSDVIRVVGGALEDGRVERNLCAPGGGVEPFKGCRDYGRGEARVWCSIHHAL